MNIPKTNWLSSKIFEMGFILKANYICIVNVKVNKQFVLNMLQNYVNNKYVFLTKYTWYYYCKYIIDLIIIENMFI